MHLPVMEEYIMKPLNHLLGKLGLLVCLLGAGGALASLTFEPGFDRMGMDYSNFDLGYGATPCECLQACQNDARCRAYTFVRAGVQGPRPRCWLKYGVPAQTRSTCCTSGYKY